MATNKRLHANGGTLDGELMYTFEVCSSLKGQQIKGDEMFIVVGRWRVMEKSNGTVAEWQGGAH